MVDKYEEGDLNAAKEEFEDLDESAVAHMNGEEEPKKETEEEWGKKVSKRIGKEVGKRKAIESERDVYKAELEKANLQLANFKKEAAERQKAQLEKEAEMLKTQAKSAMEEGEVDSYMDLNDQLLDRRVELASVMQQIKEIPEVQQAPQQQSQGPSDAAQEWLGRNEWFYEDKAKAARAQRIEAQLRDEGYSVSDPETYKELDARLNPKSDSAGFVNTPGNSIPNASSAKKRLSREDLILMGQYGLDKDNPTHRAEWLAAKGA